MYVYIAAGYTSIAVFHNHREMNYQSARYSADYTYVGMVVILCIILCMYVSSCLSVYTFYAG